MSHDTDRVEEKLSSCNGGTCPAPQTVNTSEEQAGIEMSRRHFLKGAAATVGLAFAGVVPAFLTTAIASGSGEEIHVEGGGTGLEHLVEHYGAVNYPGEPVWYADPAGPEQWAMVIDVNACVGCRKCVYACVRENNIGRESGFTYIQVMEMELGANELELGTLEYEEGGRKDRWYLPVQCMHCAKPSCVDGCPVTATWREPDGIVVVDYNKCIACRNCLTACPYEARHFNWVHPHIPESEINPLVPVEEKHGTPEKCTFCVQRTRNGLNTACTDACPVGARTFGDLRDPESAISKILRTKRTFRLKEELGNEPAIWYVG